MLSALGADNGIREELVELARDSGGPHWVATSLPEQHRQIAALLEIERDATTITDVSAMLMPGLLQTANYARAITTAGVSLIPMWKLVSPYDSVDGMPWLGPAARLVSSRWSTRAPCPG